MPQKLSAKIVRKEPIYICHFPQKSPRISGSLFCGKWPASWGILWVFATLYDRSPKKEALSKSRGCLPLEALSKSRGSLPLRSPKKALSLFGSSHSCQRGSYKEPRLFDRASLAALTAALCQSLFLEALTKRLLQSLVCKSLKEPQKAQLQALTAARASQCVAVCCSVLQCEEPQKAQLEALTVRGSSKSLCKRLLQRLLLEPQALTSTAWGSYSCSLSEPEALTKTLCQRDNRASLAALTAALCQTLFRKRLLQSLGCKSLKKEGLTKSSCAFLKLLQLL